ncbi:NADH-quinone oxidoreductase subunit N [Mucilaginibacter sp. Bleaf8]|uniref:NADH-quinone oxidoreductase subunit N n=1 Tax=Mucilaginibacter sp. Bleaf8 TaxID=2834430 RepID=UPI001BD02D7B|nr:NADH-quinone oxidoreductase subunit N [Mucilaginibacter sp. Bleaf8]MBS7564583.1 NADH-quinone oxidoreductase subunit N [Mucilaginibacter sp. Bleaf8]
MNEFTPYIHNQLNDILSSLPLFRPELCLGILFLLVLVTDLIFGKQSDWIVRILACGGLLFVLAADVAQYKVFSGYTVSSFFNNNLLLHHTAIVLKMIIDAAAVIILLYMPWDVSLQSHPKGLSDAYTVIVASVLGMHLMVMSGTWLTIFLSVEMVSLASYLLVAYRSENSFSAEASLKYVLFGLASSAVMLYGISLFYGFTGTLALFDPKMVANLQQVSNSLSIGLAIVFILAGLGFKLSLVPLHFWVPDVYQGAATPVTAFLSTLPKIAAFGMLINFLTPFITSVGFITIFDFRLALSVAAIITLVAGNFAAIWQQNVKRMLAYSSIGHTGFGLMAIVTFSGQGITALNFYLAVYAIANIAALGLVSFFANAANAHTLNDYRGLGIKYPVASVSFVILVVSLTGLPVSAGFNAKLLVFSSVYSTYQQNHNIVLLLLLITGALTTVVSLFYYIKVPLNLFLKKPEDHQEGKPVSVSLVVFCALSAFVVLFLGLFPNFLAKFL